MSDKHQNKEDTHLVSLGSLFSWVQAHEPQLGKDSLVVIEAEDATLIGTRFVLERSPTRIGRGDDCEVLLKTDSVSRRHARVEIERDHWVLVDEGSANGTFRNGERIVGAQALGDGDRVQIVRTLLKFLSGADVELRYHEELHRMSVTDALTQLFNRRHFEVALEREVASARASEGELSIMIVNIDHFRRINDAHGQLAGDFVLKELANLLRIGPGEAQVVARIGGEEFAVLLCRTPSEAMFIVADELRARVAAHPFHYEADTLTITVSVGVATLGREDRAASDLLKRADFALHTAKREGRDRVVAAPAMDDIGTADTAARFVYRRMLDGPSLLAKALAKGPPGVMIAFEMAYEGSIVASLGSNVYEQWFRELIHEVETAIERDDALATWRDRYVLAGCWRGDVETAGRIAARVQTAWATRPVPAGQRAVTRKLRAALLTAAEFSANRDRALDVLVGRLRQRPPPIPTPESELPFPVAALGPMVDARRTALGRARALLDGIESALRFATAVALGAARDLGPPELLGRIAPALARAAPGEGQWESLALTLVHDITDVPVTAVSATLEALAQASVSGAPLTAWLPRVTSLRRAIGRQNSLSEDAYAGEEVWLRSVLDAIVASLRPLAKLQLVSVAEIEDIQEESVLRYALHLHRGPAEHFPIIRRDHTRRLHKGWCHLLDEDMGGLSLSLAPIVASRTCDVCGRVEVATADRLVLGPKNALVSVRGVTSSHEGKAQIPWSKRTEALHEAVLAAAPRTGTTEETRLNFQMPPELLVARELAARQDTVAEPLAARPAAKGSSQAEARAPTAQRKLRVFYSYAHPDQAQRDRLAIHLKALERQGLIEPWHDLCIPAGREIATEVDRHFEEADVVLLLVSADFIASDYRWDREIVRAVERHERGEAVVVPILLSPCDCSAAPFARLQSLPRNGIPVSRWGDKEDAWFAIAADLRKIIVDQAPSAPAQGRRVFGTRV